MSSEYSIVIGLEVHVQLATQTKLFCGCSTAFGAAPNTNVCPVCLGHPGVLPVLNKEAFEKAVRTGIAMGCTIAPFTKFDRKHYYYPDLPKNYQISQYDMPFAEGGKVDFTRKGERKSVRLIRIHLEEDAGKLVHDEKTDVSYVDLNRTGTPLMEIVSKPDITSPEEAYGFLAALKLVLRYLDVSDCNMEEGSLRCDANINIRVGDDFTPISEVKNLNSFRGVEQSLAYEAERQYREYVKTGITKEQGAKTTVGWDAERQVTVIQRSKEEAHDYRYFPEPDIPPIHLSSEWIQKLSEGIRELPLARKERMSREFGLNDYNADLLVQDHEMADYFESMCAEGADPTDSANFVLNDANRELGERGMCIKEFSAAVSPSRAAALLLLVKSGEINANTARETVLPEMISEGKSPGSVIREKGLIQISDETSLEEIVLKAIRSNPKGVSDYNKGKKQVIGFFIGQVMKETSGQANIAVVKGLLEEHLNRPDTLL